MLFCRSDRKNRKRLRSYPIERFPRHLLQKQSCCHMFPRSLPSKGSLRTMAMCISLP